MKGTTCLLVSAVLFGLSVVGCRGPQRCPPRPCVLPQPCAPRPCLPGACPPAPVPGGPPVFPGAGVVPPGAVQAPPLPPAPPPPPSGAVQAPAPNFPAETRNKIDYRWYPSEGQVQLAPPEPIRRDEAGKDRIRFGPLEPVKPAPGQQQPLPPGPSKEPPSIRDAATPPLPVGIPQFAAVQDKIAAGLRPSLDDGLDWLKSNGYRTILHIRGPGEENQADRKQVEKRGLVYLSLEVSPQALNKQMVDEFSRMVSDAKGRPLFVYDRDGSLAGGLWYLHFRLREQLPDDAARIRANALGLKEQADGAYRLMWLAVQKYLNEQAK